MIHDKHDLSIIYTKLQLKGLSRKRRQRVIKKKKRAITNKLLALSQKIRRHQSLSKKEAQLYSLLGKPSYSDIRAHARALRHQKGQRDAFYNGLIRSQKYIDAIREEVKKSGLPKELACLPHVESSFNYKAYSKVGAAGIWQFMRSTGKRFLKIGYVVDERRDPIRSTEAAMKLLSSNYKERQQLDLLPRCWHAKEFFSVKKNQKLWNKSGN